MRKNSVVIECLLILGFYKDKEMVCRRTWAKSERDVCEQEQDGLPCCRQSLSLLSLPICLVCGVVKQPFVVLCSINHLRALLTFRVISFMGAGQPIRFIGNQGRAVHAFHRHHIYMHTHTHTPHMNIYASIRVQGNTRPYLDIQAQPPTNTGDN